jgi:IS30 family transposase
LAETERAQIARWLIEGRPVEEVIGLSGRSQASVERVWAACGGFAPRAPRRREASLCFGEREEISRGLAAGASLRAIAAELGRAPSTVSREVKANGGRDVYRAELAERRAVEQARRPQETKLAAHPVLCAVVQDWLMELWSPQQVTARLIAEFPDDPEMRVSHETVYKALFIQGRGELRRELTKALRSGRARRRPHKRVDGRRGKAKICDMVLISERPADVEDRAVPGHWEGDLIVGKNTSLLWPPSSNATPAT